LRSQVPQKGYIPFSHHPWDQSFFFKNKTKITEKFSLKISTTPPSWIKNLKEKKRGGHFG
jgi:hypothetical protein